MARAQLVNHGSIAVNDNLTRFSCLNGALTANATEANIEIPVREAGAFSNLYVFVSANTATVTSTVTLRKDLVDTALTLNIGANLTGVFENTTNSVSFAATTRAAYEITVPTEAGTNTLTITIIGVNFLSDTSGNTVSFMNTTGGVNFSVASVTRYLRFGGFISLATAEANNQFRIRNAGTTSDFSVYVSANARTTNTVFTTRKNAADGGQTVTFGNVETGWKEATGTDSLIAGDDYNFNGVSGTGIEIMTIQTVSVMYVSTNSIFPMFIGGGLDQAFNVTNYKGLGGNTNNSTTTENNAEVLVRFTFTVKELSAYASSNTITTSASTIRLRDNNVDGNLNLSYAAAETGLKVDSVNTDVLTTGVDTASIQIITPNTSGTLTLQWIGVWGEVVAAGGGVLGDSTQFLMLLGVGT